MCLKAILALFQKPKPENSQYEPIPLAIPHPEEPMNPQATVDSVGIDAVRMEWLVKWLVPPDEWDYWKSIPIYVTEETYGYPAFASLGGGEAKLFINPKWANKGVLAHELSHVCYFLLLTPYEQLEFDKAFAESLVGDALVMLLDKENDYMNTSNIEGYAEVYRYLGERMPDSLKKYYPELF
jgi:hypothetical protein